MPRAVTKRRRCSCCWRVVADVNATDRGGRVPLHFAATAHDRGLVDVMLAAGADVNAADATGETALHFAARRLSGQSLRALIEAGADVNARNRDGETPLQVLGTTARCPEESSGLHRQLETLLIDNGANPAMRGGDEAAVRPQQEPFGRDDYRTYAEILALLQSRASSYPTLCQYHELVQQRAVAEDRGAEHQRQRRHRGGRAGVQVRLDHATATRWSVPRCACS